MLVINAIVFYLIVVLLIMSITLNIFNKFKKNKPSNIIIPINPEEKKSDMKLICETLDTYILKELHYFTTKDFVFDPSSDVKKLFMNNYRLLIKCLLSPKQIISSEYIDDKKESSLFFSLFINRIYLNYISETSDNIKSLLFKYYSGYTKYDYFNRDKKQQNNPSALPFIINYVRNYLWCRYEENEKAEQKLLDTIRNGEQIFGADSYEMAMNHYDISCCRKLASNIYHSIDIEEKSSLMASTISEHGTKNITDQLNRKINEDKQNT